MEYSKKKGGRDEEQRKILEGKATYLYLYNRLLPYSDVLGSLCSSVLTTRRIRIIGFADVVTRFGVLILLAVVVYLPIVTVSAEKVKERVVQHRHVKAPDLHPTGSA